MVSRVNKKFFRETFVLSKLLVFLRRFCEKRPKRWVRWDYSLKKCENILTIRS